MTLGELFRKTRIARGVTQKQIANLIGVSEQFVCDVELNRKRIKHWRVVYSWMTYLGLTWAQCVATKERKLNSKQKDSKYD